MHSEHGRILLCVKLVHIYACNDIPSEKCAKQCKLQRELGTPNALASNEYGAFANAISAREFLMVIKNHTRKSPWPFTLLNHSHLFLSVHTHTRMHVFTYVITHTHNYTCTHLHIHINTLLFHPRYTQLSVHLVR